MCNVNVNSDRRSTVLKHRESLKHQSATMRQRKDGMQTFISMDNTKEKEDFVKLVLEAFLSADIPIYKANNPQLKSLFSFMGKPLPSETTLRSHVSLFAEEELLSVKSIIQDKQIFLVVDETDVSGRRFFNTLIGIISEPQKTYLIDCRTCEGSVNQQYVVYLIDDLIRECNVSRHNFSLLLSDAARYMAAAGNALKFMYPQMFHVTCVSHLLHNCAEKVRGHYANVDNVIARVKAFISKNKSRRNLFHEIGIPPQPVVTRWGSWLNAAIYYADNLPAIKEIIHGYEGNGLLVSRAKDSLHDDRLTQSLMEIKRDYSDLIEVLEQTEATAYSILHAYEQLKNIRFGKDACGLRTYLDERMEKNADLLAIVKLSKENVSPSTYVLLQKCQATSSAVERSFSMLKKLLAKDRQFKDDNVKNYLIPHYNSVAKSDHDV